MASQDYLIVEFNEGATITPTGELASDLPDDLNYAAAGGNLLGANCEAVLWADDVATQTLDRCHSVRSYFQTTHKQARAWLAERSERGLQTQVFDPDLETPEPSYNLAWHMALSQAGPIRYVMIPRTLPDFRGTMSFQTCDERGASMPPLAANRHQLCALRSNATDDGDECPQERVLVNTLRDLAQQANADLPTLALTTTRPLWAAWNK